MEGIIMNTSNITNYKPKDFAELLGVSVKTLQRWDREGILKANRTPTDRRYYTYDQYLQFKGINTENDNRQIVIYARVSTKNQKDDLQNQVTFLRQFCNAKGIIVDQCIEDYGSGLNYILPFSCTIIRLFRSMVMSDTAFLWFSFTPTDT